MGGKSGGGGGPSQEFYDKMMELSQKSQQLGDLYNAIEFDGYRPGDSSHQQIDKYYQRGAYTQKEPEINPKDMAGFETWKYQGQTYSVDPATNKMYDGSGKEITNKNVIATVKMAGYSDGEQNSGGRSAVNKSSASIGYGAGAIVPSGYDPSSGVRQASASGPFSNYSNIQAANGNVQKEITKMEAETARMRQANEGRPYIGADGKYYINSGGNVYDASSQGLNQLVTDSSFGLVKPTTDLAKETIQSQREIIPSSTKSQISVNDLLTAQNTATQGLINDKSAAEKAGYGYQESKFNTDKNLEGDRELSTRIGYGAQNSLNQSTINQGASRDLAAISANNLSLDQNESARRLVGDAETANRSDLKYKTAQNESGTRLIPYNENASMADLQYKTDYARGAGALLPKRFQATEKFIDESMKGTDINAAMDEAGVEVSRAFGNADAANRRNLARMGVVPNAASQNSSRLNATKALIGARALAKKNAQDDNYRRLGAVGLSGL